MLKIMRAGGREIEILVVLSHMATADVVVALE